MHINYVGQFLPSLNARLPYLTKLHVEYEHLGMVTENFIRNATRMNFAKPKYITFHHGMEMVYSTDFSSFFHYLK